MCGVHKQSSLCMWATNKKTTPKMQDFKLIKNLGKYFFSFCLILKCLHSWQDIVYIKKWTVNSTQNILSNLSFFVSTTCCYERENEMCIKTSHLWVHHDQWFYLHFIWKQSQGNLLIAKIFILSIKR